MKKPNAYIYFVSCLFTSYIYVTVFLLLKNKRIQLRSNSFIMKIYICYSVGLLFATKNGFPLSKLSLYMDAYMNATRYVWNFIQTRKSYILNLKIKYILVSIWRKNNLNHSVFFFYLLFFKSFFFALNKLAFYIGVFTLKMVFDFNLVKIARQICTHIIAERNSNLFRYHRIQAIRWIPGGASNSKFHHYKPPVGRWTYSGPKYFRRRMPVVCSDAKRPTDFVPSDCPIYWRHYIHFPPFSQHNPSARPLSSL